MSTRAKATIADLYHVPENGKAESVDGELLTPQEEEAEDIALARAIDEGVGSATGGRDEVFVLLDGEQYG